MTSFSTFHPAVIFVYYMSVLIVTMFSINPIILGLSLLGSLLLFLVTVPVRKFLQDIGFYILVFLLIAITNPIFSHNGETILFFLNDNPVTFEAIIYGVVIAMMLIAVIFWSKMYSEIMTSDKFIYLFGKIIPKLALVISMALRFIPMFKQQLKKINQAQKTLGLYTSDSITDRVLGGIRVFNSVWTWSLENAIHQADSMKARGYGLKGRTNFSLFKIENRDKFTFIFMTILFIYIMLGFFHHLYDFTFYPTISSLVVTKSNLVHFVSVFVLMVFPFIIEVKENIQWKLLRSKI
jgi:energy-coupling factor transport system permease protein